MAAAAMLVIGCNRGSSAEGHAVEFESTSSTGSTSSETTSGAEASSSSGSGSTGGECIEDACSSDSSGSVESEGDRLRLTFQPIAHPLSSSLVTDLQFFPDGSPRFMVCDRDGNVSLMQLVGDEAELLMKTLIDGIYIERTGATGLLGLALDPDIVENGFFYLAMTLAKNRVAVHRYTLDPTDPEATAASAVTILDITVPGAPRWHNITSMGFDEAGVMWLMVGDKGMFDPAQDPSDLLGSLIRILPSKEEGVGGYETPPDAPLHSPGADPAVYAIGLRSPWRAIYHQGRWYFGDVGGNKVEEVNVIDGPGLNFGWPIVEGPCKLDDPRDCALYVDPLESYTQSNSHPFVADDPDAVPSSGRSVYVGWIYRPNELDPYQGLFDDVLTFGDIYVGFVRAVRLGGSEPSWHAGNLRWPTAWGQGPDGYVYVAALGGWPPPAEGELPPSRLYRAVLTPDE